MQATKVQRLVTSKYLPHLNSAFIINALDKVQLGEKLTEIIIFVV
jgi:hypothetical protein